MFDMRKKITLTPEQEKWLTAHFKHTKNEEIGERLGISQSSVHRFARELGLTKTKQFMRKLQKNTSERAKASHLRNGTYPPKGYRIPRSEESRFKPGETSAQRIGKAGERRRIEKSAESRRRTFKEERSRRVFGLPQRTGLRVIRLPRYVAYQRYHLRKLGYIVPRGGFTAYYTPETRRSRRYEDRPRDSRRYVHFEFRDISEMPR
jgi:hypothetical protein